ncbi:MAG: hypothetical protein KatS3mg043_0089 [Rhodothermaceae bacterium]|nr:MAG: hypothetical protein KatS3mg043_0089 [Rhodothermaceae bacterium]
MNAPSGPPHPARGVRFGPWTMRHPWRLWTGLLALVLAVHLLTLTTSPPLWQDEVQQVDFGRLVLEPESAWSAKWSPTTGRPIRVWSYVAPLVHEAGYRLAGGSPAGSRLAALLGAFLAASALLAWLLARRLPAAAALMTALAFLLDPLMVKSYKGGRVDGWAMAAALAACLLLRRADEAPPYRSQARLALAGALTALAPLLWQSAVILYPLILLELIPLLHGALRREGPAGVARRLGAFAGGGLLAALVALLPLLPTAAMLIEDARLFLASSAGTGAPLQGLLRRLLRVDDVAGVLLPSAPLVLAGLAGLLVRRAGGMALALLGGYVLVSLTLIYSGRVLYLLPYLAPAAALLIAPAFESPAATTTRRGLRLAALGLTGWAVAVSLVARPLLTFRQADARDPAGLYRMSREVIGEGPHRVYLDRTFPLYFPGRPLGWHLYAPNWEIVGNNPAARRHLTELFDRIDFAVFEHDRLGKTADSSLRAIGLTSLGTFCPHAAGYACPEGAPPPPLAYGPYTIYARAKEHR